MKNILPIAQILVSIFLIFAILLQKGGLIFGRGFYFTKRGIEKKIFWATIILGVAFIILALLNLILK